ncbi:MAG: 30S ribosomal protein S16 [Deltaproteobacteria bacterium]|nr:30S ribosomal protein S16 [Deltaproteobacteria bacterium]
MTTRIRLARAGKKKRPYYRIVVADSHAARDGRFVERVGSYDPLLPENKCTALDVERVKYWLGVGALPTERVSKLLSKQGIEHKMLALPREDRVQAKLAEKAARIKAEAEAKKAAEAENAAQPPAAPAEA